MIFGNVTSNTGSSATSTASPLAAGVPIKLFGIMFLVILAGFLIWYLIMRGRE
jgi:hypothetical protein